MSIFKYGDLTVSVESLGKSGDWEEFGIKIEAPGHPREAFRIWHPEERDHGIVAQVFVYDLIEAYEDPQSFQQRMDRLDRLVRTPEIRSLPGQTREFLRVALDLHPYFWSAITALHKEWGKTNFTPPPIVRGPREWLPSKKKN